MVREGFFMRKGRRRSLSAVATRANISEFGGTAFNEYFLQSLSFRFWNESLLSTEPFLTADIRSADRRSSGSAIESPVAGFLLRLLGSRMDLNHRRDRR